MIKLEVNEGYIDATIKGNPITLRQSWYQLFVRSTNFWKVLLEKNWVIILQKDPARLLL